MADQAGTSNSNVAPLYKSPWLASLLKSPALFCVKVGSSPAQEVFYVHEWVLKSSSIYFGSLLGSEFIEASTREVTLNESVDSPEVFRYILEYMYSPGPARNYVIDVAEEVKSKASTAGLLHVRIFLMANRLCMAELERLVYCKIEQLFTPALENMIWNVHNLCTAIELLYSHTVCDRGIAKEEGGRTYVWRFRVLFAKFSAFSISYYRGHSVFGVICEKYPDFTLDLLEFVRAASDDWDNMLKM